MKLQPPKFQPFHNHALTSLENNGSNPYHVAHVQKAFEIKKPKINGLNTPEPAGVGSPWTTMGAKK